MSRRQSIAAIVGALLLVTLLEYLPVTHHQFVAIDDHQYITENPPVAAGLTLGGIVWAFTTGHASNWHPITWISHMVDCQFYGLNAGGHHLMNVLFHVANSLLLFFVLFRMTGGSWRSACVAALFAWHPLHVESVAWASERKDVLSTFFFLLTLLAWFKYTLGRDSSRFYLLSLVLFALGLMSKPMLVTLPCVLLLLDFWPLDRLKTVGIPRLLLEKIPFFALSLADGLITCFVQRHAASSFVSLSFSTRLANALFAYVRYLANTFWPVRLAVIYPYSRGISLLLILAAVILLGGLTVLFLSQAKRRPWMIVGWFWFLGTLVPTIGLIQVGSQSMADRYTYIPSIGIFVILAWAAADLFSSSKYKIPALAGISIVALGTCLILTSAQLSSWANSETLFRHALDVTRDNYTAWDGLGSYLDGVGKREEAIKCYRETVRLQPHYAQGQYDLGTALLADGKKDEAMTRLEAALTEEPGFAQAHINLGKAFLDEGKIPEALEHLQKAAALAPDDPEAQYNLGTVLLMQSHPDQAAIHFTEALRLKPHYADAHRNMGIISMGQGKIGDGVAHFAEAARLQPDDLEAHFNLGLAYLQAGQPADAAAQFGDALQLNPDSAKSHLQLAVALLQQKKSADALPHAHKAADLARTAGDQDLAAKAAEFLKSLPPDKP